MTKVNDFKGTTQGQLTQGFSRLVDDMFPGPIHVEVVAAACASLLGSYCIAMKPSERVLLLAGTVDALLGIFHDHPVSDLIH